MLPRLLRRAGHAGLLTFAALFAGCGGGSSSTERTGDEGRLQVLLTDSQGCSYESVEVTLTHVRVRPAGVAEDAEAEWIDLARAGLPAKVDLMALRNGRSLDLGTLALPAGEYTQVRLVLAENGSTGPYANQLTLAPGTEPVALKTPSAQQSGLKVKVDLTIPPAGAGEAVPAVLTLDFDPCKSIVRTGNPAGKAGKNPGYILKPVVTAYVDIANNIQGYTRPGARVSAQQGGASVKSTTADDRGQFVLWPVALGRYDLVITRADSTNAVLAGVEVTGTQTVVSEPTTPLLPSPSALSRAVRGTVTVAGAEVVDAGLRALQTVGTYAGSTDPLQVEVASTSADLEFGTYSFTLPTTPPERAFWKSGVRAYDFAPAGGAGHYDIEARAAGFALPQTVPVSILTADAEGVDFAFGP
jgi:hypothetical protein